jgi:hypothetical protein
MMPLNSRVLKLTLHIFIGFVLLITVSGVILSRYVHSKIKSQLESIGSNVGSLHVNLFTRSITASKFQLSFAGDSANSLPHQVYIQNIELNGINLYSLLAEKKLTIREVVVDSGRLRYNTEIKLFERKDSSKNELTEVRIKMLTLKNLKAVIIYDSTSMAKGLLNFSATEITAGRKSTDSTSSSFKVKNMQGGLSNLEFYSKKGMYLTKVAKLHVDMEEQQLIIDSIELRPLHGKFKFAKVANKQIDRVNAFISKVKVSGLNYDQLLSRKFLASKIDIYSSEVYSFRDKRMPFREKEDKPLPMAALKKLEQEVEVDSLQLHPSKVTYEEFPPDGFKSGKIVFENLQATMNNISNRSYYNKSKYSVLQASSKLLGKGLIEATFLLPIQDKLPYQAKGKISSFNLYHLNPILENLAFISVSSGRLNSINFNFDYNDRFSNGALTINYRDLKIVGLTKEKKGDVSDMKTFLINTIVKNDKDKNVPIENRTGTITFERDRKRQIFNFWWKSLLSGIKNSVLNAQKQKNKTEKK